MGEPIYSNPKPFDKTINMDKFQEKLHNLKYGNVITKEEKLLLSTKRFFDKCEIKYTITITDGDNISVNVRE